MTPMHYFTAKPKNKQAHMRQTLCADPIFCPTKPLGFEGKSTLLRMSNLLDIRPHISKCT